MNVFQTMTVFRSLVIAGTSIVLGACGQQQPDAASTNSTPEPSSAYVVLDAELAQLRRDFNAHADQVRLLFISGPTCGICLRGLADLNDAFIEARQNDPRLHTFVVHVPVLGAREEDAAQTIALLDGPRVSHYWDGSGRIGQHYQHVLEIGVYAWDVWLVYPPGPRWDDALPPAPDFWQHQLPIGEEIAARLDARQFKAEVESRLARLAPAAETATEPAQATYADGTAIPGAVGLPLSVALSQHIRGRGGYDALKRIRRIEQTGTLHHGQDAMPLRVELERPNALRRIVGEGANASVSTSDGREVQLAQAGRALSHELEQRLLLAFEFDGPLVEWKDKGHRLEKLGMEKQDKSLAWKLDLVQAGGAHWELLVDSHSGDIVRRTLLDETGEPELLIFPQDYRVVSGYRFPFRIDYRAPDGKPLAAEVYSRIEVEAGAAGAE